MLLLLLDDEDASVPLAKVTLLTVPVPLSEDWLVRTDTTEMLFTGRVWYLEPVDRMECFICSGL